MPRITISYRRDDSLDITGRIFDRLATHFGRDAVFRDIDNIPPGANFRRYIDQVLDESDIILAIIGPQWLGPRAGQNRIANAADPVRLEIETALRKEKPVIPVLVSQAAMPNPDQLPESIAEFAFHNALRVDGGQDFDMHLARLTRAVERISGRAAGNVKVENDSEMRVEASPTETRPDRYVPMHTDTGTTAEDPSPISSNMPPVSPVSPTAQSPATIAGSSSATSVEPSGRKTLRRGLRWTIALGVAALLSIGVLGWWAFIPRDLPRREAATVEKNDQQQQAQADAEKRRQEQQAQADAEKRRQEQQAQADAEKRRQEQQAQADAERRSQEQQAQADVEKRSQEQQAQADAEKRRQEQQAQADAEKARWAERTASPDPELALWQTIQASWNPSDFDEYLKQFPDGRFAREAGYQAGQLRDCGHRGKRGWIGIKFKTASENGGALVVDVSSGGPAHGSGIQAGDVIHIFGGVGVRDGNELRCVVGNMSPGDFAHVVYWRSEAAQETRVKIGTLTFP